MSDNIDVYRRLQQHLDTMPIGFPKDRKGSDIRLLKQLFTPEEAEIAIYLKFSWNRDLETLETIYERIKHNGYTIDSLEKKLDRMVDKGSIQFKKEGKSKFYGNALLIIGMYEYQVNKLTPDFIKEFQTYLMTWVRDSIKLRANQLRTIPIEQSIIPEQNIANYDHVMKLVQNSEGPFMVANCICRQTMDQIGEPCKLTSRRELCLGFGYMAQSYIDTGKGRPISREDAIDILRQNEHEGLILEADNSQELQFICSCCNCCCESIANFKKFPNPGELVVHNFFAEIDEDLCTGCGVCLDFCQMEAITQIDSISKINLRRCIGCGNCVVKCPSDAIKLNKREKEYMPPANFDAFYDKIALRKRKIKEGKERK